MTSPYDIDEIFPEDAAGAVRLPRRQTGNSPQDLAVTLLADYTLRTRAWLPSAAIVTLLGEAGVSPAGARTAISRLARRGVLEGRRHGRQSSYRLTAAAAGFLIAGGGAIVSPVDGGAPWDEHWTLVAFSLPQAETARRRGLRAQLRWMGYAPLYDGLWVSPRALTAEARAHLERLAHGALTVFRARHVDVGAAGGRAPIDAWDTAAVAAEYDAFIRRWRATRPRVDAGHIAGAEAVRVRTEVMDDYRRLPILDPGLPAPLLPAGWLREPARDLFAAVYDGLAHAAERHVRAVAAGGPARDVRAHTVAELAAGLAD
ncbi:PaaX family transcriptional regulator [Catenuloplanes atrovinosus]|uniref:Phenylacetic acid degradation operon negative regulatory protein n=1 Tax=Catenuloplanes atrovinosus TaxID=137266 RepID=A0AAE3YZ55_9ACTN|nr:PaaX family transcriptional regulator C-terminal domain-containing protein [Catenuloplanes atrovinosus]MDR7280791.1 phenylacetic acid degradation operon negative regulatory protein [Catenuloplanes atrovinosus]